MYVYENPTIGSVLERVLAVEELAGRVVTFTNPTGIQSGHWSQYLVTAHRLYGKSDTNKML